MLLGQLDFTAVELGRPVGNDDHSQRPQLSTLKSLRPKFLGQNCNPVTNGRTWAKKRGRSITPACVVDPIWSKQPRFCSVAFVVQIGFGFCCVEISEKVDRHIQTSTKAVVNYKAFTLLPRLFAAQRQTKGAPILPEMMTSCYSKKTQEPNVRSQVSLWAFLLLSHKFGILSSWCLVIAADDCGLVRPQGDTPLVLAWTFFHDVMFWQNSAFRL